MISLFSKIMWRSSKVDVAAEVREREGERERESEREREMYLWSKYINLFPLVAAASPE